MDNIPENNNIIYYNCEQVSKIIEEPTSTIRYLTKMFNDILDVEIINTQRKYKEKDIENLLFIKKLIRINNMSIKQVQEYFVNNNYNIINYNSHIEFKVFTKEMSEYFDSKINLINKNLELKQNEFINNISNIIDNKFEVLLKNNEKMKEDINVILKNQESIKEENEEIHRLQKLLVDKKMEYEKSKSWFDKIKDKFKK